MRAAVGISGGTLRILPSLPAQTSKGAWKSVFHHKLKGNR